MGVDLTTALIVVLSINAFLFLGQMAVNHVADDTAPVYYNCEGSLIGTFEASHCSTGQYDLTGQDPSGMLPSKSTGLSVSAGSGNIITDSFISAQNWLLDKTGASYIFSILVAPANFLKAIGLPSEFAFAVGAIWYGVTLFLIVSWIMWR